MPSYLEECRPLLHIDWSNLSLSLSLSFPPSPYLPAYPKESCPLFHIDPGLVAAERIIVHVDWRDPTMVFQVFFLSFRLL